MTNPPILIETMYLPPVGVLAAMVRAGVVYIEAHENYQKRGYRNRCEIGSANGRMRLTVPLRKGKNEQQPIRNVRLAYDEPWRTQHWTAIRSAYGRAPFFEYYADEWEQRLRADHATLFDYNFQLLRALLDDLGLPIMLRTTDKYDRQATNFLDLRNSIRPVSLLKLPYRPYPQVFAERFGFQPQLSGLDLLFCMGPEAAKYLHP